MWKVYANRVCGLVFRSDLCSTEPWIRTRSPEWSRKIYVNNGIITTGGGRGLTWVTRFKDVLSFLRFR
jgi:hypothetical protein